MRLMKGSWARPLLALASAVVAVLIVFGGWRPPGGLETEVCPSSSSFQNPRKHDSRPTAIVQQHAWNPLLALETAPPHKGKSQMPEH